MSNTLFFWKRCCFPVSNRQFYSSEIDLKSLAHRHESHSNLRKPLLHDRKSYFLYIMFLGKFTRLEIGLHPQNQLNNCCTSLCEPKNTLQKQLNHSFPLLKTISYSGNSLFPQMPIEKMVCTSDLNSTFDTNACAILNTLFVFFSEQIQLRSKNQKDNSLEMTYVFLFSAEKVVVWIAVLCKFHKNEIDVCKHP